MSSRLCRLRSAKGGLSPIRCFGSIRSAVVATVVGWNWAVENTSGGSRPSTRGTRRTRRCGLSRCSPSELRVTDRSRQDGSDFCRLSDLPERWKTCGNEIPLDDQPASCSRCGGMGARGMENPYAGSGGLASCSSGTIRRETFGRRCRHVAARLSGSVPESRGRPGANVAAVGPTTSVRAETSPSSTATRTTRATS